VANGADGSYWGTLVFLLVYAGTFAAFAWSVDEPGQGFAAMSMMGFLMLGLHLGVRVLRWVMRSMKGEVRGFPVLQGEAGRG